MSEKFDLSTLTLDVESRFVSGITVLLPDKQKQPPGGDGGAPSPGESETDMIDKFKNQLNVNARYENEQEEEQPQGGGESQEKPDIQMNIQPPKKEDDKEEESYGSSGGSEGEPEESEDDDQESDGTEEPGEGKSNGGKPEEPDKGEPSEGEPSKGDPSEGEPNEGEPSESPEGEGSGSKKNKKIKVGDYVKIIGTDQLGIVINVDAEGNFSVDEIIPINEGKILKRTGKSLGVFDISSLEPYLDTENKGGDEGDKTPNKNEPSKEGEPEEGEPEEPSEGDPNGQEGEPSEGDPSESESSDGESSDQKSESSKGESSGNPEASDDDFQKMIDTIKNNQSSAETDIQEHEAEKIEREEEGEKGGWNLDDSGKKKLKDLADESLNNAKKEPSPTTPLNKADQAESERAKENANKLLGAMGMASLTSLYRADEVQDWRRKLEKMLDDALDIEILIDPNVPNKKIEDAPPGVEFEYPRIKNIAILLDCSLSMGFIKFSDVCRHLQNLFAARNMTSTHFHVVPWGVTKRYSGDNNPMKEIEARYETVVGHKGLLAKLSTLKGDWNSTDITYPFMFLAEKLHVLDVIIVMTDGEYGESNGDIDVVHKYIKRYQKKILWVFTADHLIAPTMSIDPSCKKFERTVVFKKGT
jgi:hypothetical protein